MTQPLYLVVGGELKDLGGTEFRDPKKAHVVGVFEDRVEATNTWRGHAQQTVDNALMRYFVIPVYLSEAA